MKSDVLWQLDSRVSTICWHTVLLTQLLKRIKQIDRLLALFVKFIIIKFICLKT